MLLEALRLYVSVLFFSILSTSGDNDDVGMAVDKICVQNSGTFWLRWIATWPEEMMTDHYGVSWGPVKSGQTQCQNFAGLPRPKDGDLLQLSMQIVSGGRKVLDAKVRYNASSRAWATYTCKGTSMKFDCHLEEEFPAQGNVRLPWGGPVDCFAEQTFDPADVRVERNVAYGWAANPYLGSSNKNETLFLDAYFPPDKGNYLRPLFVFIHGGAFIMGDKFYPTFLVEFVKRVASHGYVVASINYRMVPAAAMAVLLSDVPVHVSAEDTRAAVRFLRKNSAAWRIDTDRIVVGGESAGALTALYYGYVFPQAEGNSGNPGYSSSINAVFSISGSLKDEAFCAGSKPHTLEPFGCSIRSPPRKDFTDAISEGDIPLAMIHGMSDLTIPYANGRAAAVRANSTGVRNVFVSIPFGKHVPWIPINDRTAPYFSEVMTFLSGALDLKNAHCPVKAGAISDQRVV